MADILLFAALELKWYDDNKEHTHKRHKECYLGHSSSKCRTYSSVKVHHNYKEKYGKIAVLGDNNRIRRIRRQNNISAISFFS